jgi:hypothetical protein
MCQGKGHQGHGGLKLNPQLIQDLPQIPRQRAFEGYRSPTLGVEESQMKGVQELPAETEGIILTPAVKRISDQGMSYLLEMGADLMGHTSSYLYLYKTEALHSDVRSELG